MAETTHQKKWDNICPKCGKKCLDPQALRLHMKVHPSNKWHTCSLCGKKFPNIVLMNSHIRFQCNRSVAKPFLDGKLLLENGEDLKKSVNKGITLERLRVLKNSSNFQQEAFFDGMREIDMKSTEPANEVGKTVFKDVDVSKTIPAWRELDVPNLEDLSAVTGTLGERTGSICNGVNVPEGIATPEIDKTVQPLEVENTKVEKGNCKRMRFRHERVVTNIAHSRAIKVSEALDRKKETAGSISDDMLEAKGLTKDLKTIGQTFKLSLNTDALTKVEDHFDNGGLATRFGGDYDSRKLQTSPLQRPRACLSESMSQGRECGDPDINTLKKNTAEPVNEDIHKCNVEYGFQKKPCKTTTSHHRKLRSHQSRPIRLVTQPVTADSTCQQLQETSSRCNLTQCENLATTDDEKRDCKKAECYCRQSQTCQKCSFCSNEVKHVHETASTQGPPVRDNLVSEKKLRICQTKENFDWMNADKSPQAVAKMNHTVGPNSSLHGTRRYILSEGGISKTADNGKRKRTCRKRFSYLNEVVLARETSATLGTSVGNHLVREKKTKRQKRQTNENNLYFMNIIDKSALRAVTKTKQTFDCNSSLLRLGLPCDKNCKVADIQQGCGAPIRKSTSRETERNRRIETRQYRRFLLNDVEPRCKTATTEGVPDRDDVVCKKGSKSCQYDKKIISTSNACKTASQIIAKANQTMDHSLSLDESPLTSNMFKSENCKTSDNEQWSFTSSSHLSSVETGCGGKRIVTFQKCNLCHNEAALMPEAADTRGISNHSFDNNYNFQPESKGLGFEFERVFEKTQRKDTVDISSKEVAKAEIRGSALKTRGSSNSVMQLRYSTRKQSTIIDATNSKDENSEMFEQCAIKQQKTNNSSSNDSKRLSISTKSNIDSEWSVQSPGKICSEMFLSKDCVFGHRVQRPDSCERPFSCLKCGKRFKSKYHLTCHMETHSNIRRHKCMICRKAYTRKSTLTRHKKRIHGIENV